MAVSTAVVRRVLKRACARTGALGACAGCGLGVVVSAMSAAGGPWTW